MGTAEPSRPYARSAWRAPPPLDGLVAVHGTVAPGSQDHELRMPGPHGELRGLHPRCRSSRPSGPPSRAGDHRGTVLQVCPSPSGGCPGPLQRPRLGLPLDPKDPAPFEGGGRCPPHRWSSPRTSDPYPAGRTGSDAGGEFVPLPDPRVRGTRPATARAMIRVNPEFSPRGVVGRVFVRRVPIARRILRDAGETEKGESPSPGADGMGSGPQFLGEGDVLHALGRAAEDAGMEPGRRRGGNPPQAHSRTGIVRGVSSTGAAPWMRPRRRGPDSYRRIFPCGATCCVLPSHRAGQAWGCPNLNRSL